MIPFKDDIAAKRYPIVTVLLIVANCVIFIYQLALPRETLEQFIFQFGIVPSRIETVSSAPLTALQTIPLTILTSMFLHGGWFHLIGNMWYLWIFGDNVEDRMGHSRFLLFYLLCGSLAGITHILFNPDSPIPSIGASGAVAGVLGAYLVSYPFARILTIIPLFIIWPIIELPAILVLGSWFLMQLLNGTAAIATASQTAGGVAWWAHIGGFLTGLLLIGIFARKPLQRYSW